jgi:hypothetical protein
MNSLMNRSLERYITLWVFLCSIVCWPIACIKCVFPRNMHQRGQAQCQQKPEKNASEVREVSTEQEKYHDRYKANCAHREWSPETVRPTDGGRTALVIHNFPVPGRINLSASTLHSRFSGGITMFSLTDLITLICRNRVSQGQEYRRIRSEDRRTRLGMV